VTFGHLNSTFKTYEHGDSIPKHNIKDKCRRKRVEIKQSVKNADFWDAAILCEPTFQRDMSSASSGWKNPPARHQREQVASRHPRSWHSSQPPL
jgi:hypothetical protein